MAELIIIMIGSSDIYHVQAVYKNGISYCIYIFFALNITEAYLE